MFGWFSPKCPLDTYEKTWTEWRMRWLADQFGIDRLLQADVILPTEDFFPDSFAGTAEDAENLLELVSSFMGVDARKIRMEVCLDAQLPGAAGHYDRGAQTVIRVAQSQLADATRLVATLAHELAHEMLLGRGLLSADVPDHEHVTDLLPVFLGVGIFAANATVHEDHGRHGNYSWWTMGKSGYLPSHVFGYAFALFAFMRDEEDPAWASHLRPDASAAVRDGLRFLRKTADTLFHPDTIRDVRRPLPINELVGRLRTGAPSFRLAALWEIAERAVNDAAVSDSAVVTAVAEALADDDRDVSGEAGRTLAALGGAAVGAVPQLVKALMSGRDETRIGAAAALAPLCQLPEVVVPDSVIAELGAMLEEKNRHLVTAGAQALCQFGTKAQSCVPRLLAEWRLALIDCDALMDVLAGTLLAISPDPQRQAREFFADDAELRRLALQTLAAQRKETIYQKDCQS